MIVEFSWFVVTPPVAPNNRPVTVERARQQCRIPDESQDDLLAEMIDAAAQYVQTSGRLILCPQTIRVQWPCFPGGDAFLNLPLGPVRGTVTLEYKEPAAGAWTAIANFQPWLDALPARLAPAASTLWPATQASAVPSVRATYAAGYATASAIPANLKNAVLMLVRINYESPDGYAKTGTIKVPDLVEQMVGPSSRRGYP